MNELDTTRQKLVETATNLYMRLGIKSVSMDDIARELGVSKKTIYTIVDNKDQLVKLVMEEDHRKDKRQMEENHRVSRDAIDELLMNSRYNIREMRKVSPATLNDLQKYYPDIWHNEMKGQQLDFENGIRLNLERGMEEGLYREDLDSEVIAKFFVASVFMMVDTQTFPALDRPLSDIIRQHFLYHFNGIVNQFGRERMEHYLDQEDLN